MITAGKLREKFSSLSVLVVGDICLDIDYIGGYSGYSREVEQLPIFRAEKVKYSPGGGGNLAVCFATLGLKTTVAGYWGDTFWHGDPNASILSNIFEDLGINIDLMYDCERTGVFIKYYLRNGQHIYRSDVQQEIFGIKQVINLKDSIEYHKDEYDFMACADYDESDRDGVCSPMIIEAVRVNAKVKLATSRNNIKRFKGFDYQIQNEKEIRDSGINLDSFSTWVEKDLVVTKGGKGAGSYNGHTWNRVSSKELTENIDPCGCGDMFYSIYASSVMAGYDTTTCLQLANAGARVVARKLFGTGQATVEELVEEWKVLYG